MNDGGDAQVYLYPAGKDTIPGGKLSKRKCNLPRNIRGVDFVYTSAAKFGLNWDGKKFARKNPAVVAAGL
jgi:hypothetical protein